MGTSPLPLPHGHLPLVSPFLLCLCDAKVSRASRALCPKYALATAVPWCGPRTAPRRAMAWRPCPCLWECMSSKAEKLRQEKKLKGGVWCLLWGPGEGYLCPPGSLVSALGRSPSGVGGGGEQVQKGLLWRLLLFPWPPPSLQASVHCPPTSPLHVECGQPSLAPPPRRHPRGSFEGQCEDTCCSSCCNPLGLSKASTWSEDGARFVKPWARHQVMFFKPGPRTACAERGRGVPSEGSRSLA